MRAIKIDINQNVNLSHACYSGLLEGAIDDKLAIEGGPGAADFQNGEAA